MTFLHLALPIGIACALALPARSLVLDHPDEVAATLAWITELRRQAARVPPEALPPVAASPAEAVATPPLSDPFGLRQQEPAPPIPTEASRPRPRSREDDESAADDPQGATPPLPPPPPAPLRLLGSLQQDGIVQALVDIAGTTYRLGQGDALPGGLGKVAAVSEDSLDITDGVSTRTIRTEPAAAPAPPSRPPRQGRRRLTRPGAPA